MNFQPLTLVLLLAFLAVGVVRALLFPMKRNLLRLAAVPVAFLCSLLLQFVGIQKVIAGAVIGMLNLAGTAGDALSESPDILSAATAAAGAAVGTVLTVLFFLIFLIVLRTAIVPLILKKTGGEAPLDSTEKKTLPRPVGIIVSAVCGLVSGFLILGVCLNPVFFVMGYGADVSAAAHEDEDLNSAYQKKAQLACETFVDPFWDSIAIRPYRAFGVSGLLGNCAAVGNSFRNSEGTSVSAVSALHTLCRQGVHAFLLFDSNTGSDAALGEDLHALFDDPMISGILADAIVTEATSLRDTGSGKLIPVSEAEEGLGRAIMDVAVDNYIGASHSLIRSDLLALADTAAPLGKTEFFNGIVDEDTRSDTLAELLADSATLETVLYQASGVSICDDLIQTVFENEIGNIAVLIGIPADDAGAYDATMQHLVTAMNSRTGGYYSTSALDRFIRGAASSGKTLTQLSYYDAGSDDEVLYKTWKRYQSAWNSIRSQLVIAGEDSENGSFWYYSETNDTCYSLDAAAGKFVAAEPGDGAAKTAILCQKMAFSAVNTLYNSNGKATGNEVTADAIRELMAAYSVEASSAHYPDAFKTAAGNTAAALQNSETFTYRSVTAEKIKTAADFSQLAGENRDNDIRSLIRVIVSITDIYGAVNGEEAADLTALIGKLGELGRALDALKAAKTTSALAPMLLEGLLQNSAFSQYLSVSVIRNLNASVEAGTTTYESFLVSLQSLLGMVSMK